MTEIMRRREGNDFSMNIKNKYLLREDEIGDIARSLEQDQRNRQMKKILETTRAIATELNLMFVKKYHGGVIRTFRRGTQHIIFI